MKENDYYGHYKAFVKELSHNPAQTLQVYCRKNGVVCRRLYEWMRRHHISLRILYQTYRTESKDSAAAVRDPAGIGFRELIPAKPRVVQSGLSGDSSVVSDVCVNLPSGITVCLGECSVSVLSRLISGLAGKEVSSVLS